MMKPPIRLATAFPKTAGKIWAPATVTDVRAVT